MNEELNANSIRPPIFYKDVSKTNLPITFERMVSKPKEIVEFPILVHGRYEEEGNNSINVIFSRFDYKYTDKKNEFPKETLNKKQGKAEAEKLKQFLSDNLALEVYSALEEIMYKTHKQRTRFNEMQNPF